MGRGTTKPITEQSLGAWVVSCDPKVWDLDRFVADGERLIETWSVRQSYRTDLMAAGQRVLLWVSGGTRRHPRGFWGSGWVRDRVSTELENDGYWIDEERRLEVDHRVPIALRVFEDGDGVAAADIREHPVLREFELFRAPQMSNPSWLTRDQLAALEPLLPPWPEDPGRADDVVVVGRSSATRGDAATQRAVEMEAMATVQEYFIRRGGSWKDVSALCLGYDLECADADGTIHHVEVKGLSGPQPSFLLTRNEHVVAATDPHWELAVVTNALEPARRRLTFRRPSEVLGNARPYVYQVDLGA